MEKVPLPLESTNIVLSCNGDDNGKEPISIQDSNLDLTFKEQSDEKQPVKISGFELQPGCTIKVETKDGKKEGKAVVYSSRKMRIANLNFLHDQLHGLCTFYDDSGKLQKEAYYEHGVHNGWGCEYKDSKRVFEGLYRNGVRFSSLKQNGLDNRYKDEISLSGVKLSCCMYNDTYQRTGLGYVFEGETAFAYPFENGKQGRLLFTVCNDLLTQYDETNAVVYKGGFTGSIKTGFAPAKRGMYFDYKDGVLQSVKCQMDRKVLFEYEFEGLLMKEYEMKPVKVLVYEGAYKGDIDKGFVREGRGCLYSEGLTIGTFENNQIVSIQTTISESTLYEYAEGKIVYIGEYRGNMKEGFCRSGKGVVFTYANETISSAYRVVDGDWVSLYLSFPSADTMCEYNEDGAMVYKGGFSKNKRNEFIRYGKGDEFDKDCLVYSGEWKENERSGKGLYYADGILRFEGEWKHGYPVSGKCFDEEGKVLAEGEWDHGFYPLGGEIWLDYRDGQKVSIGEDYQVIYKGEWKDGKPHGQGSYYENGELKYSGVWTEGRLNVKDSLWFDYASRMYVVIEMGKEVYHGEWSEGKPNGIGSYYEDEQEKYTGTWKDGLISIGYLVFFDFADRLIVEMDSYGNEIYRGEWKDGEPDGQGSYYEKGKVKYSGKWKKGKLNVSNSLWFDYASKEHVVIEMGKEVYRGEWHNGKPNGKGTYYEDEQEKYTGTWKDGLISIGYHVFFDFTDRLVVNKDSEGNVIYRGEWKSGKPHGYGSYYENGKVEYLGEWKNGYFHVKGAVWFNYMNGKEEVVVPMKKGKTPKFMNVVSIEEVTDVKTSRRVMWGSWLIFGLIMIVVVTMIIRAIYIESCQCDLVRKLDKSATELIIPEGSCNDAKRLDLSGFKQLTKLIVNANSFENCKKVVLKSIGN